MVRRSAANPISINEAPEQWLELELPRLRAELSADETGRCRPHAVSPDGVVVTRPGKVWESRQWALFDPPSWPDRQWRLIRTVSCADKPHPSPRQVVVPILRTVDMALDGARTRAAQTREHLDRTWRDNAIRGARDRRRAGAPPDSPIAPTSLNDLPTPRRQRLLDQLAGGPRPFLPSRQAALEHLIRKAQRPCGWRDNKAATGEELRAVLGSDNRYHLLVGPDLVCAETSNDGTEPALLDLTTHRERYQWRTDNVGTTRPREEAMDPSNWLNRTYTWPVTLTAIAEAPEAVAPRQRCSTAASRNWWPAYHDPATVIGRLRRRLTEELGNVCGACHYAPAMLIDHDHTTGLVRGLLCRRCNNGIDHCPHVCGCPWANYLNNPPAQHLQIPYPVRGRQRIPIH